MIGIDRQHYGAIVDGITYPLTPAEWYIWETLWDARGDVVGLPCEYRWHIARMRKKLGADAIQNRRGFGYSLNGGIYD